MPLYKCLHYLLNVPVFEQTANKMGLQNQKKKKKGSKVAERRY
jgi:hypothetical protein